MISNNISEKYQNNLDANKRKKWGIYYTPLDLTDEIIKNIVSLKNEKPIWKLKVLEPCVGTGNFIFSYLKYINDNFSLEKKQMEELINNIYVNDIDSKALEVYFDTLTSLVKEMFDINLNDEYRKNIGQGLIYDLSKDSIEYISIETYFGNIKFDLIMTNPPYKSLRAEKRHFSSIEEYEEEKNKYEEIKKISKSKFNYVGTSSPNIFKYFVEEIIERYSTSDAVIALVIPSSILKDKSCEGLRTQILKNTKLRNIINVPEDYKYLGATQALCTIIIEKNKVTDSIKIQEKSDKGFKEFIVSREEAIAMDHGNAILLLDKEEYKLLKKMNSFPKIKDLDFIHNKRGELDVNLNKEYITNESSLYKLIRGRNIKYYELNLLNNEEFVSNDFINLTSKKKAIKSERIICQQIANVAKNRRLTYTYIGENYVLGNSCNYIQVEDNNLGVDIYYLLGLLNSKKLDWYFKLFSSNNHINNYEIDNFPIPVNNLKLQKNISLKVQKLLEKYDENLVESIEKDVLNLFEGNEKGINTIESKKNDFKSENLNLKNLEKNYKDFEIKALKMMSLKEEYIRNNYVLNNTTYKLSDLDLEMIENIPPGGNWSNIPQETMNKSKRLLGIQKTGGRTTLYGRMEFDKPSYTITTYFNRPGNGAYIYPTQNRVITTREAARLQGFSDDYMFIGNQKDIQNQIGNAVPPLIGYLLGKELREKLNVNTAIDLFSGAGGLFTGVKESGINHILATDFNESACATLKLNHPETKVICGDITLSATKEKIIKNAKQQNVDLICGGPPCQGFSLAGYRNQEDPRNQLFRDFLYMVEAIKPKAFVFENVVGILSYRKGETFKEIQELFRNIGYDLEAKTLDFSDYGVPQRRKRVIIIGVKTNLNVMAKSLFPSASTSTKKISVAEALKDLENIVHNKESKINSEYTSNYIDLMKKKISFADYYNLIGTKSNQEKAEAEVKQLSFLL